MLFDTHTHYDDERFNDDRNETIISAKENGVSYILNASSDLASVTESVSLAHRYDFVYAAVGIHPHEVGKMDDGTLTDLEEFAADKKVVAIGEIGLDYYYDTFPRDIQKYWFARQINLAKNLKMPVIVHDRDAHEDVMSIINDENAREVGGVFHCFSGSIEMARELLNKNFYISIGGTVTFKNAKKVIDVVKYIPDDRLLVETDCPYLTPEPYRGKRNESTYVKYVAQKIAEIKGMEFEQIANITTQNAKRIFNIDR